MRWLLSLIAAAVLVALPASGASGHAGLVSSNPEDGAVLDVAPEEVVLTFSEELLSDLVEVSILDADDTPVVVTEVPQTPPPGTDVKVPWPVDAAPGEYSVAFRVVSADGHPVTGRVTFSFSEQRELATAPSPSESPSVEGSAVESVEPAADEPVVEETVIEEEVVAVVAADEPSKTLIGPLLIVAAVIVGIGVVISIVMLARSRR